MKPTEPSRNVDILVNNVYVLTMDGEGRERSNASIAVDDGRIVDIGPTSHIREKCSARIDIDASQMLALPGLVNAHNHLFQVMCRGLGDDADLSTWAARAIWPLAAHLDAAACEVAGQLACLEMVESGTTTVVDSHYLNADRQAHDRIAQACLDSGMRAILGRAAMDTGGVPAAFRERPEEAVALTAAFIEKWNGRAGRLVARPEAMNEVVASRDLILELRELSRAMGTGFHIHVAETRDRPEFLKQTTGFRSVEYLDHLDVLDDDVVLAHCVWVDRGEREAIARSGAAVAHNPISNQFLADGVAPVPDFLDRGIRVGLGTDGAASNNSLDMFEVMKSAALMHKVHGLSSAAMTAEEVLKAATIGGARALGIDHIVGSLETGKCADIVLLGLDQAGMVPCYSPSSNAVYCSASRAVRTVIVDGKVVVENGRCVTLDRRRVIERARRLERRLKEGASLGRWTC